MSDAPKKQIAFPSFKSALKLAPAVQKEVTLPELTEIKAKLSEVKPALVPSKYLPGKFFIVLMWFRRRVPVVSRPKTEVPAITFNAAERKGDAKLFRVEPSIEEKPDDKELFDRLDYELIASMNAIKIQWDSSTNSPLGDFVPFYLDEEAQETSEEESHYMSRQKELNHLIQSNPRDPNAWIQLVDLQDWMWRDTSPTDPFKLARSAVIEKQLAILERAKRECPLSVELRVRELKCKSEILTFEETRESWNALVDEFKTSFTAWWSYLDWLQFEVGLGKFSVNACLEAFERCFPHLKDDARIFELLKRYCLFLKDCDFTERLFAFLFSFFALNYTHESPSSANFLNVFTKLGETPFTFSYDLSLSRTKNWAIMESQTALCYWTPLTSTEDPDEPVEDPYHEVVWEDIEGSLFVTSQISCAQFVEILAECLGVKLSFTETCLDQTLFLWEPFWDGFMPRSFQQCIGASRFNWKSLSEDKKNLLVAVLRQAVSTDRVKNPVLADVFIEIILETESFSSAEVFLKGLLVEHPDRMDIILAYSRLLRRVGRIEEALCVLSTIRDPSHEVFYEIACLMISLGRESDVASLIFSNLFSMTLSNPIHVEALKLKYASGIELKCASGAASFENIYAQKLHLTLVYLVFGFRSALEHWRNCNNKNDLAYLILALHQHQRRSEAPHKLYQSYEHLAFEALSASPLDSFLFELAFKITRRSGFRNRLRVFVERRTVDVGVSLWGLYIDCLLLESHAQPFQRVSLCEKVLESHPTSDLWRIVLTGLSESKLKSALYTSINARPFDKQLYMFALSSEALRENEAVEFVNIMDEKGLHVRRLLEECTPPN